MQHRAWSKFGPESAHHKQIMDTQFLTFLTVAGDAAYPAILV